MWTLFQCAERPGPIDHLWLPLLQFLYSSSDGQRNEVCNGYRFLFKIAHFMICSFPSSLSFKCPYEDEIFTQNDVSFCKEVVMKTIT